MNTRPTLASLAHHPIWVGWKQETRAGKPTKRPHVAKRMTSLLPKPLGSGTRKNGKKREYI
jgi:hypothetical protein